MRPLTAQEERASKERQAKHFREMAANTKATRAKAGLKPIRSMFDDAADRIDAELGITTTASGAAPKAAAGPVTDLVKGIVDKVMKTPTAPPAPAAPARDPKILELERALASKDAELRAELAKLEPRATASQIDEWANDKGGCRSQFAGDFKAFAAYRRNVG